MREASIRQARSRQFRVRVRGPIACFTRPEFKAERVSYEVMTPSAARGILEAILWKPAIRWRIETIAVLAPISWISLRRNEGVSCAVPGKRDYFIDDDRAQRNTVALRDVDYIVAASFSMVPERAGDEETPQKFEEMFERRLDRGQRFHAPYLGCREFAARVEVAPDSVNPIDPQIHRPLGLMFYDFEYEGESVRPLFFQARLKGGVVEVPPLAAVLRENR